MGWSVVIAESQIAPPFMNVAKRVALSAYRFATRPYRFASATLARRNGSFPISVLFYHRVADEHPNPWTISNAGFKAQLDWLCSGFDLISLSDCQARIRSGFSNRPALCITFDDGYAENSQQAIPLLLERQIPFTYFVAWKHVRHQRPFAHDVARRCPLAVDTVQSIRAIADQGVEIGSHTLSHVDLGAIRDEAAIRREVVDSKTDMEQFLGRPVRYFAFPFGQRKNLNRRAFELGKQAGYRGMCSAYGGYNEIGGDAFHLQRFHGDPELDYLRCWLDFDPRVRRRRPYEYLAEQHRS
jgi:peptidoglycan/xylan/chitin deacetylase (PgdA/CDA1 family)